MATAIGTTIRLSWMKPADEGNTAIRGYKIERSADDGSGNSDGNWEVLEADTGTTATAYDDEGLGHGETYHYRVSAFNSDSAGPVSNVADATIDIRGPVPVSASVAAAGTTLTIGFDEALDAAAANLLAAARFAIAAPDGARFAIGAVSVSGTHATLALASGSAVIRTGQAVTVAYTDPNAGDDTGGVVQDAVGNDAEDFTLGPSLSVTVNNGSTEAAGAPGAPENFAAEPGGDTSIVLTWDAPADTGGTAIASYRIEVSPSGADGSWTALEAAHDAAIERRYPHTGLDPATTRHYRIRAMHAANVGAWSAVQTMTTSGAPDAPTGLEATAGLPSPRDGTTLIDLVWMKPADEGDSAITSYRIEWSADGASDWTELVATHDTMAGGAIVTGYTDTGLGSETTRHYRVFAINDDGRSLPSDTAHTTTADIAGPEPVSASVTASGTALTIVFDETLEAAPARLPAAARFRIAAADGAEIAIGTVSVSATDVSLTFTSGSAVIRTGQAVTVAYADPNAGDDTGGVVQDDDGNDAAAFTTGESGVAAVDNNSGETVTAPGAPRALAAEGTGGDRIRLRWDAPVDTGGQAIAGYLVEASESGAGGPWAELVDNHNTMNDGRFEYVHMNLDPGDVRHYRIRARNATGLGAFSNVDDGTAVPPGAPDAPPQLTATANDAMPGDASTRIDLAWAKPANEGDSAITGYRIKVSADVDPLVWRELVANHAVMENGAIVTAYADTGLGSEETRHYRVFAMNGEGRSLASDVAHATTGDIAGPEPASASVAATGDSLTIVFDEALDAAAARLPAAARFEISAPDGAEIAIGTISVSGTDVTLAFTDGSAVIRQGQAVTVAYSDANAGDDARGVVQDDDGNDAAPFTLGPGLSVTVSNGSAVLAGVPGAPRKLAAEGTGGDRIRLRWDAPADTGGQAIAGYLVEVSESGAGGAWTELVDNHNTMNDGRFEYVHMNLEPGDVRHYRIRARNAAGLGAFSNVDDATAVPPGAPDAPPKLTATANDAMPGDASTRIDLAWATPANEGDSAIAGYRIEVSADVDPLVWRELAASHAVMENGAIVTAYADTGLGSEETRHYRVFAINGDGRSLASDAAHATTGDIERPEPVSASVAVSGRTLTIAFDEALEATARAPAAGRFRMTAADGARFRVGAVSVSGTDVTLDLHAESPVIRADQAVAVAYTDLTANDDAGGVVQDDSGNDAADFTLGPGLSATVTNGSAVAAGAPGAPRNLGAESGGADRIVVRWDAPADTGGRAVTSYRIEVSEDGAGGPYAELVAEHTTMTGGRFEYEHMNRGPSDVRHYRVAARNAPDGEDGRGPFAGPVEGSVELKGRVALTADPASAAEGGSVAWTVTATTDEDARPEDGLAMQVRVVSVDGTAHDDSRGDYAAVDETVTFAPGDFDPQTVDGQPRHVAVKTGTVAIVDDVEVEDEERFSLSMSIAGGGTGWARGADRVAVAIPDTDEWRLVVAADPASVVEGETHEVVLTARVVPGDPGDGSVPPTTEADCVVRFPVSVRLETGGTATAGTDYRLDGALDARTIAPCGAQTSWPVSLAALVDAAHDPGETVTFAPRLAATPAVAPASLTAAEVTVREARGVVLGVLALTVEEGGSASYTAVLSSRPTGTVTLTASVSGDEDVTVEPGAPARLEFTPESWHLPQTLTVSAAQDPDDADDAARVSHLVAGSDYAGVTAADVPVAVHDDDKTFGTMTVRLSDGVDGAGTHDPAPVAHHGEPFHITLWWSELRTDHYETPGVAIGPDRAIRVTGAAVTPVKDDHTGKWTQSRLRLKLTPEGTGDVTLVLEPMDCSYPDLNRPRPDPRALCAWLAQGQGITGLAERVRWTVRGIGAVPAAPRNLTLGTDEILTVQGQVVESRTVLVAGFDADPDASHWRVEAQAPGGDWSSARVWRGAKHGSRHNVRLDGLAPDGDWAVRARWENRYGPGPWAQARTTDGRAPEAPQGLAVAQGPDGRSVALTWTPSSAVARYQYRLGRLAQTMTGGWRDIPDSGPGAANRASFTVDGVERVWEIKAQLRAVSASGQAGAASAEARVPAARPLVLDDGVAVTSDPGEDGLYAIGDRIEVAVTMSRPVRREGAAPVVRLEFDGETRDAALVRIRQPGTAGIGDPGDGSGDTLVFAYAVREDDEDMDGIAIPANGLRLNGGRLLDASPGGRGDAAAVGLGRARHFPGHRVQGVLPEVTGIERLDNRVWVHYERDLQPWTLDPVLRSGALGGQFHPDYSLSRPVWHAVIDARIVRGRGWSRSCGRTETGCRTVRLTLGKVYRDEAGGPGREGGYEAPDPGETVEISYAPNPHHAKYRLRDAAGNEAPAFGPMVAVHLAPGTAPVLAVDDGAGREGVAPVRFTVRLAPAATERVTVQYMTADMPAAVRAPAGRASAGDDYEATSGTLVFAPGETVKTIEVTVLEDTEEDSGEVFRLVLANPSGAVLGDAEATGTIWNDELLTATFGSLPPSHDGETAFTLGLAFSEEVAVSAQMLRDAALRVTGGSVTGVRQVDAASTRRWEITVAPSSDAAVTVALAPKASCDAVGAVCTGDGLGLDRAAEAAVPGPAALGAPAVAGVAQVGSTLEASVAGGAVTWQWLRGGEEIAGADASTYTPVAVDAGARLAVRAGRGGASATSAATAPVWPAPVNPPLGAGEEELLSAVLTLGSLQSGVSLGGYGRMGDRSFGAMDDIAFEDGGTAYAIEQLYVLAGGSFSLGTDSRLPGAAGVVAYWNGYRISGLERTGHGGMLFGRTPQPESEYSRYMDGSSDGVRVAVSLRRMRAAVRVTGASVTSGRGDNGTWDAGEHVEAQLRFSAPVTVTGPEGAAPTLAIALDGARREAAYTGGSGTDTLSFRHTVATADEGAKRARIVADGLALNGAAIADGDGRAAGLGFSVAPWVAAVALAPDASGDRRWSAGETIEVRLTFSEAVTVADGTPWLDVRIGGFARPAALGYASGSGSATLVFSMEVPRGARALAGIAVVADSLVANGAAIVSQASGLAAELGHDGTQPSAAPGTGEPEPLTAELRGLPDGHGASPFTFELRFSEEIPLSYTTLQNHALGVTNGSVTAVRRVTPGENRAWDVTVTPAAGGGAVTVALPETTDCAAAGAICAADGRRLAAVSATVPETAPAGAAFRVRLVDVPEEHDGASAILFEVAFTKEPHAGYSYETMRDRTVRVRQGGERLAVTRAKRLDAPHNDRWQITVTPGSKADLTVLIGPFSSCSDAGAVCTAAGEVLANAVSETVLGPPGLTVADARVHEGPGVTVDFAVTLARASRATVTVDYATSDGPSPNAATAGEDYESTSGTLAFAPGETEGTVSVPVLDDGHDEGEETFVLTLSNPRGGNAWLADATAIGTIENSDAMPKAWLARFGRTVAEQVMEAVEGRFSAQRNPGVEVSLAGQALGGGSAGEREALEEREAAKRLEALSSWLRGEADEEDAKPDESRALTGRELLTGSAFALTGGTPEGGFASVWGRGAISRFDGREGELTLEGEVASAMLGADWTRERGTVGLMVTHSRGEGSYRGEGEGEVESTLTGLYPYGRYEVNERVSVWGVAGYGEGTLTLTPAGQEPLEAGMDLAMGAVGVRGVAVEAPAQGGLELSITSDAMAVRTSSEAVRGEAGAGAGNLAAASAGVTRLRLGLEGTWRGLGSEGGATLVPTLEVGVRHDGGDAETGFGLDVGGGHRLVAPGERALGRAARARARDPRGRGLARPRHRGLARLRPEARLGARLCAHAQPDDGGAGLGRHGRAARAGHARGAGRERRRERAREPPPRAQDGLRLRRLRRPLHGDAGGRSGLVERAARGAPRLAPGAGGERPGVDGARARGDAARGGQRRRCGAGACADAPRVDALVGGAVEPGNPGAAWRGAADLGRGSS